MKITTIRHGETDWNVAKRIQGSVDTELNKIGLHQAELLAKRLASEPCDVIYSSDLKRAKKTAEIINAHHRVELIATPNLREINFREFEGKNIEDDQVRAALDAYSDKHALSYFTKINTYMEEILQKDNENIFIVGHFGTVRAIVCYLLQATIDQRVLYAVNNTAIHTFEKLDDGKFRMTLENDTAHLTNY